MAITNFPKQEIENELMGIYPIDSRSNDSISFKRHSKYPQQNGSRVVSYNKSSQLHPIFQNPTNTLWGSLWKDPLSGLSPQGSVFVGPLTCGHPKVWHLTFPGNPRRTLNVWYTVYIPLYLVNLYGKCRYSKYIPYMWVSGYLTFLCFFPIWCVPARETSKILDAADPAP